MKQAAQLSGLLVYPRQISILCP